MPAVGQQVVRAKEGRPRDKKVAQTDVRDAEHKMLQVLCLCNESGMWHVLAIGISNADNFCWPVAYQAIHAAWQGGDARMHTRIAPNAVTAGSRAVSTPVGV